MNKVRGHLAGVDGSPECEFWFKEGRVPVFEVRNGFSAPVGYRPCECVDKR